MFQNPDKAKELLQSKATSPGISFELLKMRDGLENMSNITNEADTVETEHANKIAPRFLSNFE